MTFNNSRAHEDRICNAYIITHQRYSYGRGYTNLMFCQCSMELGGGLRGGVNTLVVIVDAEQETEPELN